MTQLRRWYARRSLRTKLALAFAAIIAGMSAAIYVYLPRQLQDESLSALADKAHTIARITAYSSSVAVVFDDRAGLAESIESALTDPDIVAVTILDASGDSLHGWRRPAEGRVVRAAAPIEHAGTVHGSVVTELSTARTERTVAEARVRIAVLAALVFAVTVGMAVVMSALITGPLAKVSAAASRIASSGRFSRVDVESRDEVGTLAATFNVMVDRVEQAQAALAAINQDLERRVLERTAALEEQMRERQRMEADLRVSEYRFRTIFEAAGTGIALLDPAGLVVDSNRALQRMLDRSRADIVGSPMFRHLSAEDRAELAARLESVDGQLDSDIKFDLRLQRVDGVRYAVCTLTPVIVEFDGPPLVLAVIEDFTEQRELTERYRQAQKLEAVGRLAGGVAHDFNNLLMTINGICDLLLYDIDPGPVRDDVEQIRNAGERAAQLTRQLLAFSRRQMLRSELVDVNGVVEEVSGMLRRVLDATIRLETRLVQPSPQVRADPGQIVQVIMNLAVNARDAMPDGGRLCIETAEVEVDEATARRFELTSGGSHVLIRVEDTGRGMDPGAQAHAFEPFFTTKPAGHGTGLGLATVYGIVRQSGGGIAFASVPDEGTVFEILLPMVREAGAEPALPAQTGNARGTETILVAEDEPAVRAFVCRVLRRQGYDVIEADDGVAALELAESYEGDIDVLLTDVVMPRRSGPDLAAAIRSARPDISVIFMSGYTPEDVRARSIGEEADAFLEKPMSPDALLQTIREVIAGRTACSAE